MSFNPFSIIKNAYSAVVNAPSSQGGILGAIGRAADAVTNKVNNIGNDLTASIGRSATLVPKPYLPPTPYGGAGPSGTQPAVVPNHQVTSGPYQNFSPAPKNPNLTAEEISRQQSINPNSSTQTPTSTPNQSYVPNQSTPQGPGYYDPKTGNFITIYNQGRPTPTPEAQDLIKNIGGTMTESSVGRGLDSHLEYSFVLPNNSSQELANYFAQFGGVYSGTGFHGGAGENNQLFSFNPSGVSGIGGGGSLLPGSLGSLSRVAAGSQPFLPTNEEEKKKKVQILDKAVTKPFVSPFDSILNNNNNNPNQNLALPNNNVLSGVNISPNLVSQYLKSTGTPFNSFQGGSNPINGDIKFQNGLFGTTSPSPVQGLSGTFKPFSATPLSQSDKDIINGVANTKTNPGANITKVNPSTKELTGGSNPGSLTISGGKTDFTTKSSIDQAAASRLTQLQSTNQGVNQQYTNDQVKNDAIKLLSERSQEIFGQPFDEAFIKNVVESGDPNKYPDVQKIFKDATDTIYAKNVDPVTGQYYNEDHFKFDDPTKNKNINDEYAAKFKQIQDQLDELKQTDPLGGSSLESLRNQYMNESGVTSKISQRDAKQSQINNIYSVYDSLATEVKDDPDFSKTLKSRRLDYITEKQKNAITTLQRDVDLLDKQIADGQKEVANRMDTTIQQYNIYRNQVKDLESNYNSLVSAKEKAADNARTAFNTLISNPNLAASLTDSEVSFIQNNGYYPASLIKKIGDAAGKDFKTIFYSHPTKGTQQTWGVTKDGKVVAIGNPVPDVSQSSSGGGANIQYKDIYDPTTNSTQRYYFNEPTQPGSMVFPGGGGQVSGADLKNSFLEYLGQVWNSKSKSELENEARSKGIDLNDKDIVKAINDADKGMFGTSAPAFNGTYSDYYNQKFGLGGTNTNNQSTMHTVISPDGTTKQMNLTPAEVQQAQSEGYRVQ